MKKAVAINTGRVKLEASGNINEQTLVPTAETRVDFISIGGADKILQGGGFVDEGFVMEQQNILSADL